MDLHLETLDDSELAELAGDAIGRLHSRLTDDTLADDDKLRLAKLVIAFEANGGRGADAAEEIDRLRETIELRPTLAEWIENVADVWDRHAEDMIGATP
jgi:hypothetical protein